MNIAIKFVNFPKPGAKYGQLFLPDGRALMCPPDLLAHFRAGMSCEVATKEQVWFRGSPDEKVVTVVAGPPGGATGPVQGSYSQGGNYPAPQANGPQRSNTGFQPRVYQGANGQPTRQWSPPAKTAEQERQIFITGVVGRAMGSGKYAPTEITVLTECAIEAWDKLMVPAPAAPATGWSGRIGDDGRANDPPPQPELGDPGPDEPM